MDIWADPLHRQFTAIVYANYTPDELHLLSTLSFTAGRRGTGPEDTPEWTASA